MQTNYEYYRIFYQVAKSLNFTQAAGALMTSQPSVSRSMQCLEQDLGCRLFVRSKRGVALTREGELLYRYIKPGCEQIMEGESALHSMLKYRAGSIHIGATETVLHNYLAVKLDEFRRLYPDIDLKVSDFNTPVAIEKLKAGAIDLAIVAGPIRPDDSLEVKNMCPLKDVLIAGSQYAKMKDRAYHIAELREYPFVALEQGTATASFLQEFFSKNGISITPKLELAATSLILTMVEHNLGLGFIPDVFVKEAIAAGKVFQIQLIEEVPERHICAVTESGYPLSAAAQAFYESL
jgi:DNA-binding transcriptional LysR family regulator